jgi:hypothetical protein
LLEWQHKAGIVTGMAVLTPDDAAVLKGKSIAYFIAATPLPEPEPGDGA